MNKNKIMEQIDGNPDSGIDYINNFDEAYRVAKKFLNTWVHESPDESSYSLHVQEVPEKHKLVFGDEPTIKCCIMFFRGEVMIKSFHPEGKYLWAEAICTTLIAVTEQMKCN